MRVMTKLITREDLPSRVENVKKSLERVYHVKLKTREDILEVDGLIPTEPFLEDDKVKLVMDKVMKEGYNVPIIVLEHDKKSYIIDGHHRAYSYYVLKKSRIDAVVFEFPEEEEYRTVEEIGLGDMKAKSAHKVKPEGQGNAHDMWEKAGKIALYFEKIHGVEFTVVSKDVEMSKLIPTQPTAESSKVDSYINKNVPIVCVEYDGKTYVVDGHNRAIVAQRGGASQISALILVPQKPIDFGIAHTSDRWGLKSLNDLKIK
jgi:IMP dehydrogenase